jgi:hypothetical protein
MINWKISPGCYKAASDRFLSSGAPAPQGLKSLARWHAPGSTIGWQVVEGDATTLAQFMAEWADLLELEITPVIDDVAAANALTQSRS